MNKTNPFHLWMKQRRMALDLSRQELAEQVGCSLATIRQLEQATRRPSRQLAERLARFLQIPQQELTAFLWAARIGSQTDSVAAPAGEDVEEVEQPATPAGAPRRRATNLPVELPLLIGRERELEQTRALLAHPETRLLTLLGPGGVGKTTLALRLAHELSGEHADGAFFIALAPLRDPAFIPAAIAKALQLIDVQADPSPQRLIEALRGRDMLLLLDNFEHLGAATSLVIALLSGCPHIKLIVTSRSPLRLQHEHLFTVPPLSMPELAELPTDAATLTEVLPEYSAVRLFLTRAQMASPTFTLTTENASAIAEICRQLDGLPLAIELAAARLRALPPRAMLSRFHNRLALLTGGGSDLPERQQTMRSLVEWSYQLLTPAEQEIFRQLSVFVGSWTLSAAEAICRSVDDPEQTVMEAIFSLHDKSLVQERHPGLEDAGFSMLETIREYALERLGENGETAELRQRHAIYYLTLLEDAEPHLTGADQQRWHNRLEWEHENVRAALSWFINSGQAAHALRVIGATWKFWQFRHHHKEGQRWIERALALGAGAPTPYLIERSKVLWGAGWLTLDLGNESLARSHFEDSLRLARESGDARAIARALHGVGTMAQGRGDYELAMACYSESLELFRRLGDREEIAWSIRHQGTLFQIQGRYLEALPLHEEALGLFRAIKHHWGLIRQMLTLSHVCMEIGDYRRAVTLLQEGLEVGRRQQYEDLVIELLRNLGRAALDQGEYEQADALFRESLVLARKLQERVGIRWALAHLGSTAMARGALDEARDLLTEALVLAEESEPSSWVIAWLRAKLGRVALEAADLSMARFFFVQSMLFFAQNDLRWGLPETIEGLAATYAAERVERRVAMLLGAGDALRAALRNARPAIERAPFERAVAVTRETLGTAEFEQAWAEGRELGLSEVVRLAVG